MQAVSAGSVVGVLMLVAVLSVAGCSDDNGSEDSSTPESSSGTVLVIDPSFGLPDTRVSVTGCGFDPDAEISLQFSGKDLDVGTTDETGSFALEDAFVPSLPEGTGIVRASTSDAKFAEFVFTVLPFGNALLPTETPGPRPTPLRASC